MILEKQTEAIVHQEGETQDSISMSLDLDSAQILMQMLSKNLYSDDIGSTVRECASNALDSHRRANVDKPIVVRLRPNDTSSWEFSVEDFGIGLDDDDVKNIISKYGKSTKRNSATELGMMGLGFKAPLAYSSSFYFVCRKNGMERKYMMYEGEDTNTIDLLYEKPTTEGNGVKVIVPVNYYDRNNFKEKIREQLAYFQNVYFDVEDIDNDFTIIRSEHFQWSPLSKNRELHICLDDVYYPIDFGKLGIDIIKFPVALRFSLTDGIFPTPNRESIRYTKEAKDIILNKIKDVANWFVEKYNESVQDSTDIISIMNYYHNDSRYVSVFGKSSSDYDVNLLKKFATASFKEPKLKGINILNLRTLYKNREYILKEYQIKYRIERGKFRECKRYWDTDIQILNMTKGKYFLFEDRIPGKKKDYLREIYANDSGYGSYKYFIKKTNTFTLGTVRGGTDYMTYMDILNLRSISKHLWRGAIKEFQYIVSLFIAPMQKVEDVEIPQEWLDGKKKLKVVISGPKDKKVRLKGDIIGKQLSDLERWVDGKNSKLVSTTYKLEQMESYSSLYVYGSQENAEKMDKLFAIFPKDRVKFVVFSERELKNMSKLDFHNWITFDKFMEGKNQPFRRMVSAYLINCLQEDYRYVFDKRDNLQSISSDAYEKLNTLYEYKRKWYMGANSDIYKAMLPIAEENKLFDTNIHSIYVEMTDFLNKYSFLNVMFQNMRSYNSDSNTDMIKICADLLKYHGRRIDVKNYKNNIIEQPVTEEVVED